MGSPSQFDITVEGVNPGLDPASVYPRHQGTGANISFVDGHAEWASHYPNSSQRLWYQYADPSPWQSPGYDIWGK
ncbi:MAG: hypothetical protein HY360_16450 [Verrucomicrobia bacterium]|nr:hypothetical protein [Verrucomicrobiota bacterium]